MFIGAPSCLDGDKGYKDTRNCAAGRVSDSVLARELVEGTPIRELLWWMVVVLAGMGSFDLFGWRLTSLRMTVL
jgi:hypothetical protein